MSNVPLIFFQDSNPRGYSTALEQHSEEFEEEEEFSATKNYEPGKEINIGLLFR